MEISIIKIKQGLILAHVGKGMNPLVEELKLDSCKFNFFGIVIFTLRCGSNGLQPLVVFGNRRA
jgi:hypothetical protein